MLEENFVNSMIKSDGHVIGLFNRPIAAVLAALTLIVFVWPGISALRTRYVAATENPNGR
jgi:TctA family transporter